MNKKFCNKCNGATLYEDEIPNACSKCGHLFANASLPHIQPAEVVRPPKKVIARQIEEEYEEDADDVEYEQIRRPIKKMEVECNLPKKNRGQTFGDLALDKSEKVKTFRQKGKKVNLKSFEKEWVQDLSKSNRQNSSEIGGQ